MFIDLASFDLVKLCGNDDGLIPLRHYPVVHHLIVRGRIVADIDQQKYCFELAGAVQIFFDQLSPLLLLFLDTFA